MSRQKRNDYDCNSDDFGPDDYEDEISDLQDQAEEHEEEEMELVDESVKVLVRNAPGARKYPTATVSKQSTQSPGWTLDDSGYYVYVLLNGPVAFLKSVREALARAGFDVAMSGTSRKPASGDGNRYNWFIRLSKTNKDGSLARPLREEINKCLSPLFAIPAAEHRADGVSQDSHRILKEDHSRLTQINGQLRMELSNLRDKQRSLERKLGLEQADHEWDVKYWTLRLATLSSPEEDAVSKTDLEGKIAVLAEEKRAGEIQRSSLETDLLTMIDDYDQKLNGERDERQRLETDCENLRVQLQAAREEVDALVRESRAAEESEDGIPQTRLVEFLAITFPKLRFLPRSISLMENEVDWSGAVRFLFQLNFNPGEVRGESFESTNGFREFHYPLRGSKDGGRLYYRHTDGAVEALVSVKNSQKSDGVYLKNIDKVK